MVGAELDGGAGCHKGMQPQSLLAFLCSSYTATHLGEGWACEPKKLRKFVFKVPGLPLVFSLLTPDSPFLSSQSQILSFDLSPI